MHAVVTGANKGIGLELYRQLANNSKDYQQIFAICRKTSAELTSLATESHSCLSHKRCCLICKRLPFHLRPRRCLGVLKKSYLFLH
jgi:NAD(P)-dependent dehydrogenase (short-subunit alcohol dehydrogenase family)